MTQPQDISLQLLDVATRRFANYGYDGTSLKSIADEVGIRKPSLLYHYNSKEELRRAVLNRVFEHWNERLPSILQAATGGTDRFNGLVNEIVAFFVANPDRARLLLREMLDRPEHLRAQMEDYLGPWFAIIEDYIEQGKVSGRVYETINSRHYIFQVIHMVVGGVATAAALGGDEPGELEQHTNEIVRIAREALFVSEWRKPEEVPRG